MQDDPSGPPPAKLEAGIRDFCDTVFDKARLFDALNALALLDAARSDTSLTELALAFRRQRSGGPRSGGRARPGAGEPGAGRGPTVAEFFGRYAARCAPEQKCSRDIARSLGNLVARQVGPDMPMECLRPEDLAAVLGRYGSAVSWNSMAGRMRAALRWGAREGLCCGELAENIPRKPVLHREPAFFAPERVEKIMRLAEAHPGTVGAGAGITLALGFFAGARTVEILRARWEDLDLAGGVLRIPKPKGWTRGAPPRLVELEENAAAWIARWRDWTKRQRRGAEPRGSVAPKPRLFSEWKKRWLAPEGLSWGRRAPEERGGGLQAAVQEDRGGGPTAAVQESRANIPRHTYATMHVAAFRDAAATALNLGHAGGTEILEKHYRGLVAKTEALKYWKIYPQEEENVK